MTAARSTATYADLLALPPNVTGQLVFGVLHAHPRPANAHANAASMLGAELNRPFRRGRGDPGGWLFLDEPELHLGSDVLVPDLAGWRKERLAEIPRAASISVAPSWGCEVLSPSTAAFDRGDKLKVWAREHVEHVWFVDPDAKLLEVLAHDGASYRWVDTFSGDGAVRAAPFEAVELDLGALWDMT